MIEDLTVRNLLKNDRPARAVSDTSWSGLRGGPEDKAHWCGREVTAVDRWFPFSGLCSVRGSLQDKMPHNVRIRMCYCGTTHELDVNAARHMPAAGPAAGTWSRCRTSTEHSGRAVGGEAGTPTA